MKLTKQQRQVAVTALVAAIGAVLTEHFIKPRLKGGFHT